MRFSNITLCLDMQGCPNRCRHCWLGWQPNGNLPESALDEAAGAFAPFTDSLRVYDWYREPDFSDRYRERWEKCGALSDPAAQRPHFELASVWRLARDGRYAPWLASLGVEAVQLTLFGGEEATDFYTGRKGAYRDILRAIHVLLENGVAPRIQVFVNKDNIGELPQVEALIDRLELEGRCREIGRRFACFVHQGSCDGENQRFYGAWVTAEDLERIPERLADYTLRHFGKGSLAEVFGPPERELYAQLLDDGPTASYVEDRPVFFIDRQFDVYPNLSAPSPAWRLGNLRQDGAGAVLAAYAESRSPAQHTRLTVPARQLALAQGDPKSLRLFGMDDYIILLLNRFCAAPGAPMHESEDVTP